MTGDGFCACGCGGRTTLAIATVPRTGDVKGQPHKFILGHTCRFYRRLPRTNPQYRRRVKAPGGRIVFEHTLVVERALGHPLPRKAVVHHVNRNEHDNAPTNLVACQNQAYHLLLHQRMRALKACGHAHWRKCTFCKTYDEPHRLRMSGRGLNCHPACDSAYQKANRLARRSA